MLLVRCVEYSKVIMQRIHVGTLKKNFRILFSSMKLTSLLIFSFAFCNVIEVVKVFFRHENVCTPNKPLGQEKRGERERNENWNFSNDVFTSSYILCSELALHESWLRMDKLHFQRQSDKYCSGRQEEKSLLSFMQDTVIQSTTTQSIRKCSYPVSATANEDGWPLSHLVFLSLWALKLTCPILPFAKMWYVVGKSKSPPSTACATFSGPKSQYSSTKRKAKFREEI